MDFGQTRVAALARRGATTWKILPAVLLTILLAASTGYSFTGLYVFGDSLSDTGRNPAPAPQYYNGRYSNGPLWVEYLSTDLGLPYNPSNNFAVAGSTTSDLISQIAGLTPSTNLQSALFTVLSGGNDFLDNAIALGVNDSAWNNVVTTSVANVTNAVNALYTAGAREIIVGNLAPVGNTPVFQASPVGYGSYVDSKVAAFNILLASAVTNVMRQDPGLRIYLLDDNTFFAKILNTPALFGFTVTTNGALEDPNLTDKSFTGPGADYVFWDFIHPTTKVNALTAAQAVLSVSVQLQMVRNESEANLVAGNLYPGLPYIVETSTNLSTWSKYETINATGTNATVVLTNGPGTKAYYRVRY